MRTFIQAQVTTEEKDFYEESLKLYNQKTGQSLKRRDFILLGIDELLRKEGLLHRFSACLKGSDGTIYTRIIAEKARTQEEAKKQLREAVESFELSKGAKVVLCDVKGKELEVLKE
jgi:hypothetical protein